MGRPIPVSDLVQRDFTTDPLLGTRLRGLELESQTAMDVTPCPPGLRPRAVVKSLSHEVINLALHEKTQAAAIEAEASSAQDLLSENAELRQQAAEPEQALIEALKKA